MCADTERPVDIVLFLPSLGGGGAERVMLDLASGLVAAGLKVQLLLATSVRSGLIDIPDGLEVVHLGARRVATSLIALFFHLRRNRPRAVLSTLEHSNVAMLLVTRFLPEIRVCVREANTLSRDLLPDSMGNRILLIFMQLLYPHADTVIAVSHGVANELKRQLAVPETKLEVISNPVITERILAGSREKFDHQWFGAGEPPVLVAAGRLTPQKDFPTLLRAFARVRLRTPCRLIILGEGELRAELQALAVELQVVQDVEFPGFVTNPFPYMVQADVFVLSSAWEGLPNVLIQAIALGTPVVSTDCPSGPSEIVEDGRYGRLVPVADDYLMSEAILEMLKQERSTPSEQWCDRYRQAGVTRRYLRALGWIY